MTPACARTNTDDTMIRAAICSRVRSCKHYVRGLRVWSLCKERVPQAVPVAGYILGSDQNVVLRAPMPPSYTL
eukprot:4270288-Amphidinium_carterae.1